MLSRRLMLESLSTERWQRVLEDLADTLDIAAAMINVVEEHDLVVGSVFDPRSCFRTGDRIGLAVNSYCAHVLRSAVSMFIADVREIPSLMVCNPTAAIGFVHYFGEPILDIDGRLIGTICVMDTRTRSRSDYAGRIHLLRETRNAIQTELHEVVSRELAVRAAALEEQTQRPDSDKSPGHLSSAASYGRSFAGALEAPHRSRDREIDFRTSAPAWS